MHRILIKGGTIVNDGCSFKGDIEIEDDRICRISKGEKDARSSYNEVVDATGCFVLPGIIDDHVHFREPGLTPKADIESESRAAAYGGVTSFMDMPNTNPPTVSAASLQEKWQIAQRNSHINYSFFLGATNDNADVFRTIDKHSIPGIKLFMGASTGNMLVDRSESLGKIFATAAELGLPVMTHCEDSAMINTNMQHYKALYGDDPDIVFHSKIRSREACLTSSHLAIELARKYGTQLHIAHISTKEELNLIESGDKHITFEAVIAHLMFSESDYLQQKALIKCNPSVKTLADRDALRQALSDGRISVIGTDHAPHLLSQKQGGSVKAASGMPSIQFSLVAMLELVDAGVLTIERLVDLMAHNPARIFRIDERGFLHQNYKADIAIVKRTQGWTVQESDIQSKCGWSPFTGHTFNWQVKHTFCNGQHLLNEGVFNPKTRGEQISFRGKEW